MRPARQLLIGPGSRVEVLVRGGPAGRCTLSSLPFHQCIRRCNPLSPTPNTGLTTAQEALLTMVSSGPAANDQLPSGQIGNPPDLRPRAVDVHRTIVLADVPKPAGQLSDFSLNHKLFDPNRVDVTMKLGSVEEWTLKNPAGGAQFEWHTFHVHQNPFQVINVNGHPRSYVDWEDNVNLAPGDTIVIRLNPIDFTGKFVFHCHVVFHEDHGMMGVAQVLANPTPSQVNANQVVYLSPHTDHAQYASVDLTGKALGSFLYYCRHLGLAAHST
jgi:suppressor of ftsI